jgi:hypothetical protein
LRGERRHVSQEISFPLHLRELALQVGDFLVTGIADAGEGAAASLLDLASPLLQ